MKNLLAQVYPSLTMAMGTILFVSAINFDDNNYFK
jgi:hypothetical protein